MNLYPKNFIINNEIDIEMVKLCYENEHKLIEDKIEILKVLKLFYDTNKDNLIELSIYEQINYVENKIKMIKSLYDNTNNKNIKKINYIEELKEIFSKNNRIYIMEDLILRINKMKEYFNNNLLKTLNIDINIDINELSNNELLKLLINIYIKLLLFYNNGYSVLISYRDVIHKIFEYNQSIKNNEDEDIEIYT
jgi:hypothetical protein